MSRAITNDTKKQQHQKYYEIASKFIPIRMEMTL
jgi:hypothetical protein